MWLIRSNLPIDIFVAAAVVVCIAGRSIQKRRRDRAARHRNHTIGTSSSRSDDDDLAAWARDVTDELYRFIPRAVEDSRKELVSGTQSTQIDVIKGLLQQLGAQLKSIHDEMSDRVKEHRLMCDQPYTLMATMRQKDFKASSTAFLKETRTIDALVMECGELLDNVALTASQLSDWADTAVATMKKIRAAHDIFMHCCQLYMKLA